MGVSPLIIEEFMPQMATDVPTYQRLTYRRLTEADLDDFHRLVIDDHVRRYLLDGAIMSRDWCREQIIASDALFASHGLGLWLVFAGRSAAEAPIGFYGFKRFPKIGPEPQLLYALLESHTGKGYATEIARALMHYAAEKTSMTVLFSAVDEPNVASSRVLEKIGFERSGHCLGAFGRTLLYRYALCRAER